MPALRRLRFLWTCSGRSGVVGSQRTPRKHPCRPDYVAAPLLGVAGAAIGNARIASPWPGWLEPSVLWVAKIGTPSTGKTPGDNAVLSLVARLEAGLAEGFDETLRQHQTDALAAKLAKEAWEDEVRTAVENGRPPPVMPERANIPRVPKRPRLKVADTTPEAMGLLMEAHPKGLMLHRDELAGFLGGFDKYGGGSDSAFWARAVASSSSVSCAWRTDTIRLKV